jgi:electron transport complex protein RnfB
VIVPELCSGCDKCLPACPIPACIVSDPGWSPAPDDWWALAGGPDDPYV